MVSISVCMIVKNEQTILAGCLDCIRNIADEIIIIDTGSSDKTKEIAHRYTDFVYDFEWIDDFSAARNFSFSKATKDYIYVMDADEIIDSENQNKFMRLKETLTSDIEIVEMKYTNQLQFGCTYNFDEEYRPKLYKRLRNFCWMDPIHETVNVSVSVMRSDIAVKHMPLNLHAKRDFSIFQKIIQNQSVLSSKIHCLYARELFIAGTDEDFLTAFPYFESTLHDEQRSVEEIRASQCAVARGSRLRKDELAFFKAALKNVIADPCAEVCCELGEYYFDKQDYEEAATWFYTAAFGGESELDIHYSGDYPLKRLSDCYYKMGNSEEGNQYNQLAKDWTVTTK